MNNSQLTRKMIKTSAILAISVGTILGSNAVTANPAQASLVEGARYLESKWGDIVSLVWSPRFLQVYMTNLNPTETRNIQNQHRSRAHGVLTDRCINRVANNYFTGWRRNALKISHRWLIDMRVEHGQANCYMRMPNNVANEFRRRRGW